MDDTDGAFRRVAPSSDLRQRSAILEYHGTRRDKLSSYPSLTNSGAMSSSKTIVSMILCSAGSCLTVVAQNSVGNLGCWHLNMVTLLRPATSSSEECFSNGLILLEAVSAAWVRNISCPFLAPCMSPSHLGTYDGSTIRNLDRRTQAASSWFGYLPPIPPSYQRRHCCRPERVGGLLGQRINRAYNSLCPSTRAPVCFRIHHIL